ncbi:MAG: hypothetical protein HY342_12710 [Candidatus Lambdaproteobacteria bacterium]|nr:hypothetical protein [Candidatus Lambdaproteobacteria bacterium]
MFELLGYVIQGFIYVWIAIIASIPNFFMGGLTICIVATLLTYILRDTKESN